MYRVYVFDGPRVVDGAGHEVRFKTQKAIEIVAWLVMHGGSARDRRAIAVDLWPRDPVEMGLEYLRQSLYFARKSPRKAEAGHAAIESDGKHLRLKPGMFEPDWADIWALGRSW